MEQGGVRKGGKGRRGGARGAATPWQRRAPEWDVCTVGCLDGPSDPESLDLPSPGVLSFCHTPASLSGCLKPLAVSWEGSILPGFLKGQCTSSTEGKSVGEIQFREGQP